MQKIKLFFSSLSRKKKIIGLVLLIILSVSLTVFIIFLKKQKVFLGSKAAGTPISSPILREQKYLSSNETRTKEFKRVEIGGRSVNYYQRMVGEAIVEKDFINYQFDKNGIFLKKIDHWRSDLPQKLPVLKMTKKQAEAMVGGKIQFSSLFYISPESDVFPIKPTPKNPCWVVSSLDKNGFNQWTVIDAVTGKKLGKGIPPPSKGYSLSGPWYGGPCSGSWDDWYLNARGWFEKMGYQTNADKWPAKETIADNVKNPQTKLFYELAHGDSYSFLGGCSSDNLRFVGITPNDVNDWLTNRDKMSFAFIGSCDGLCATGENTFSFAFKKGEFSQNSITVGYCGMSSMSCGSLCWPYTILWQNTFFKYLYSGNNLGTAFSEAMADYPNCKLSEHTCIKYSGDPASTIPLLSSTITPVITPTISIFKITPIPPTPRCSACGYTDSQGVSTACKQKCGTNVCLKGDNRCCLPSNNCNEDCFAVSCQSAIKPKNELPPVLEP